MSFVCTDGSWWLFECLRSTKSINMHKYTCAHTFLFNGRWAIVLPVQADCKQLPHSSNSRFQTILCQQWLTQQTELNHMGTQTLTVHLHNANAYTLCTIHYLNNNNTNTHTNREWDMLLRLSHTHAHIQILFVHWGCNLERAGTGHRIKAMAFWMAEHHKKRA